MAKSQTAPGAKQVFDASSPAFAYSLIVAALTVLAAAGVTFPDEPGAIAGELTTLISTSGFWALIGVAASSIFFPIYNAWKKGNLSFKGVFKNSLTWVALAVLLFDALALFGLRFPDGTAEQIVYAVLAKDWTSLISMFVSVIVPTVVRFIKERG